MSYFRIALVVVLSIGACRSGNAELVFSATFDIAISNESEFSAHYPNFQVVAGSADITVPSSNRQQFSGATESHIRLTVDPISVELPDPD